MQLRDAQPVRHSILRMGEFRRHRMVVPAPGNQRLAAGDAFLAEDHRVRDRQCSQALIGCHGLLEDGFVLHGRPPAVSCRVVVLLYYADTMPRMRRTHGPLPVAPGGGDGARSILGRSLKR